MTHRGRAKPRGQSLVEFALILPVMLLVIFGTLDLGRAVFMFNTLSESARHANRLAIIDQRPAEIRARAIESGPGLGLTNDDIDVCFKSATSLQRDCAAPAADACAPSGTYQREHCLAIVTTRAVFTPVTPLIGQFVNPPITLSSTSIGPIEYACPNQIRTTTCP
ncbi:MAG TPA: TadE family protein [Candidatus Limnocylindrales bacterium]|nr:TadE family protein [Candidatus Limnocylindrales bacterium]